MNLFTGIKGFEELEQMARNVKHKRIHYKKPTYIKYYKNDVINGKVFHNDSDIWGRMRQLHARIANFFPIFLEVCYG